MLPYLNLLLVLGLIYLLSKSLVEFEPESLKVRIFSLFVIAFVLDFFRQFLYILVGGPNLGIELIKVFFWSPVLLALFYSGKSFVGAESKNICALVAFIILSIFSPVLFYSLKHPGPLHGIHVFYSLLYVVVIALAAPITLIYRRKRFRGIIASLSLSLIILALSEFLSLGGQVLGIGELLILSQLERALGYIVGILGFY